MQAFTASVEIPVRPSSRFRQQIMEESGQDVNACYQCKKCSAGCPVAEIVGITPAQIIHAVRLGLKDLVLNSDMIWYCASCVTCTTRCPQDVDIARVMEESRVIARREGVPAALPDVKTFYGTSLFTLKVFGRLYELGLIMMLKLLTRKFTKDMELGIEMLKKGKLKLIPSFSGARRARRVINAAQKLERRAG